MKVLNIHTRIIQQPKANVAELFTTLGSKDDKMIAKDKWPAMRLDNGLTIGSKGGHEPIRYFVQDYKPEKSIQFTFTKPCGFNGFHQFEIKALAENTTELKHTIDMSTSGLALLTWPLAIRWLHNAYIEDAFDKVENNFSIVHKVSKWNVWVKFLRSLLKTKRK
jgi:hypothetical protein